MRRVLILLDVTEAEAEHIAKALVPVSPEFKGNGVKECLDEVRAMAGPDSKGMLVQLRSRASAALEGLETDDALRTFLGGATPDGGK